MDQLDNVVFLVEGKSIKHHAEDRGDAPAAVDRRDQALRDGALLGYRFERSSVTEMPATPWISTTLPWQFSSLAMKLAAASPMP